MADVRCLPVDSVPLAEANRRNLAMARETAQRIARETVAYCEAGAYAAPSGTRVDLGEAVANAVRTKISIPPDALLWPPFERSDPEMFIQVTNETTTAAAQRLQEMCRRVVALNFANGLAPGGGFLDGASAQEETLCRMSALFPTLVGDPMYAHNRLSAPAALPTGRSYRQTYPSFATMLASSCARHGSSASLPAQRQLRGQ